MTILPLLAFLVGQATASAPAQAVAPAPPAVASPAPLAGFAARSGSLAVDASGAFSPTSVGQVHYDRAGSFSGPFSVSLTVDENGGTDRIGPALFSQDGASFAIAGLDSGRLQIILVVKNRIVSDVHSAQGWPGGAVPVSIGCAADGTVTATAGAAVCSLKSPIPFAVAAIMGDHGNGPAPRLSGFVANPTETLFWLRRRMQYVPYVPGLATQDPKQTDLYSEGWSIETTGPVAPSKSNAADSAPIGPYAWHLAVDAAPLGTDPAQAGYVGYPGEADHRTPSGSFTSCWDVSLYWPLYATDLAAAQSKWLAPIYSAGRALTFDEYAGLLYRGTTPPGYSPTPMSWRGLTTLGPIKTETWTDGPAPIVAPYDAAVKTP